MSGHVGTTRVQGVTGTQNVEFTPNAKIATKHWVALTGGTGTFSLLGRSINDPPNTYLRIIDGGTGDAQTDVIGFEGPIMGLQISGVTGTYDIYIEHTQYGSR